MEPAEALALEDTVNGARAAHGAGMQVIGVAADSKVAGQMRPFVTELVANLGELIWLMMS